MGATWAESLSAVAAAMSAGAAGLALLAVRKTNSTADSVARIEQARWHHDLTPQFDVRIDQVEGDRARLTVHLYGPASLRALKEVRVRIVASDDQRRYSGLAGGRTREEVDAQVWGPWRFTYGADGADVNGHAVAPVPLDVGRGRPFSIEKTRAPFWWEGNDVAARWRNEWRDKPIRLVLEARREGHEPWTVPLTIEQPADSGA